jgi:hypothetical protein
LNNFANHDFVGRLEFEIHEVVTARNACLAKPLINSDRAPGKSGIIKIMADEKLSHTTQEEVIMSARANFSSRQNMNFFVIYKQLAPNQYRPIYKSEI